MDLTNSTNQGSLEVENGETLYVNGAGTDVSDSTITATGSTLVLGDSQGDAWSNAGTSRRPIAPSTSTVHSLSPAWARSRHPRRRSTSPAP